MIKKSKAPLGATLVVVSSVFYASYGIWTKLMGNFFGGYTASALRSVLALLILAPVAFAYHKLEPLNLHHTWRYLSGMLVGSLFVWGPLYYAILHAGIGVSLTGNYACYVIGMFALGWLIDKDRFTTHKWLSAILGFAGLGLVFGASISNFGWVALFAAAISGLGAAVVTFSSKKVPYNTIQSTIALWTTSAIANTFMALVVTETRPDIGGHIQWVYLLFFAAASVIASGSLVRGLKLIEAGAAGVLGLLEIVFGVLFGVLFFHERPSAVVLSGVVVIIVAAAIPYFKDYAAAQGV